jgi:RNA polymerase sigma-70 factor (ECF subfamily)
MFATLLPKWVGAICVTDPGDHSDRGRAADPAGATSTTLLDLAKAGDASAWERLAFVYTPLVCWWCRQQGVTAPQDVEDVTQEVLAAVAGRIGEFTRSAAGGFRRWLYTITRHKTADYFRRRVGAAAAGGTDAQAQLEQVPAADSDSSWSDGGASERAILVRQALELVRPQFQPRTWDAAWRVTVDEQPPAEVATALGMTAGAVHTAKSRVLRRLRALLADLLDEPPATPSGSPADGSG